MHTAMQMMTSFVVSLQNLWNVENLENSNGDNVGLFWTGKSS